MGHAQSGEGAVELGTRIPIVGHGIMAKVAEVSGVGYQWQAVLEKEAAKALEMIPSDVGGDKDRAQKFAGTVPSATSPVLF